MAIIELATPINAPPERCFDLSRSIDFHMLTAGKTHETAVSGRRGGLIALGETVTWRAKHFGIWQRLTVQVTQFDRPRHFQDVMTQGAFASMAHDHFFDAHGGTTIMRDRFRFHSPLRPLGSLVDSLFLTRYMRGFLMDRAKLLKATAESNDWGRFLGAP